MTCTSKKRERREGGGVKEREGKGRRREGKGKERGKRRKRRRKTKRKRMKSGGEREGGEKEMKKWFTKHMLQSLFVKLLYLFETEQCMSGGDALPLGRRKGIEHAVVGVNRGKTVP